MHMNRRHFLELTAGTGMLSILQGCQLTPSKPQAVSHGSEVWAARGQSLLACPSPFDHRGG